MITYMENFCRQKLFLPAKTFCRQKLFCQSGFYHGKNRFFPLTGKNLPTLSSNRNSNNKTHFLSRRKIVTSEAVLDFCSVLYLHFWPLQYFQRRRYGHKQLRIAHRPYHLYATDIASRACYQNVLH